MQSFKLQTSKDEQRKELPKHESVKVKCPLCKEQIPSNALRCSKCTGDLTTEEAQKDIQEQLRSHNQAIKVVAGIVGAITVFVLLLIFLGGDDSLPTASPSVTTQQRQTHQQAAPAELLELLDWKCYTEYSYFHIAGDVKNISNKPLENVLAVGTAYTEDGTFVKSSDAIIEYSPILPGQTSPFEVLMSGNPAISKCKVGFKEFLGGAIPTKRNE